MAMTREATFKVLHGLTTESVKEYTGQQEPLEELPELLDEHVDRLEAFFVRMGLDVDGLDDYFNLDSMAAMYLITERARASGGVDLTRALVNQARSGFELGLRYATWLHENKDAVANDSPTTI